MGIKTRQIFNYTLFLFTLAAGAIWWGIVHIRSAFVINKNKSKFRDIVNKLIMIEYTSYKAALQSASTISSNDGVVKTRTSKSALAFDPDKFQEQAGNTLGKENEPDSQTRGKLK